MADFYLGEDDRLPVIRATLEDETGPMDLTGGSVVLKARKVGTNTVISGSASIDSATLGQVSYAWGADDAQIPGLWWLQWQVTKTGKVSTVPNRGADKLWINEFWAGVQS